MRYKLVANITNASGIETVLTEPDLELLTDGDTTLSGVSFNSGDTVSVICDLNNRYNLTYCRYYCSGDTSVSFEVSESEDVWYTVSSSVVGSYVEASLSNYEPRWIKTTHSINSFTTLYEIEFYSSGVNILFGHSGTFDSYGLDASGGSVQAVQLFNNTDTTRNIRVFIDNDVPVEYNNLMGLGVSSSGTFYSLYEQSLNFPDSLDWDKGIHNNTITTSSGHLTLSGSETVGTYYSPVFDISGYQNCRFFWVQDSNDNSTVDFISSIDSEKCFGVRSHNIPPSGIWNSGEVSEETDSLWSVSTGSLEFYPTPNNTILELRERPYIQFMVTLSGVTAPHIYKAGVEYPVTVSGVSPGLYKDIYLKMNSAVASNNQTGLICWYEE